MICEKLGISSRDKFGLYEYILLLSPIAIWFSFWPQISLGSNSTTNFKLTITMVYLLILAIVSLPRIFAKWREIITAKNLAIGLIFLFVFYNFLTIIWSENRERTMLTSGILVLLFIVFLGIFVTKNFAKKLLKPLVKIYILTAIVMGIFAICQFIYGTFFLTGFGLCDGCISAQFGFVRPNVFAIEPQFFGSLLLPALLIVFREILINKNSFSRNLLFGFLALILFLTLSRGAIFAFIFGALFVAIFSRELSPNFWKNFLKSVAIGVLSLAVCVFMQAGTAAINPNVETKFSVAANSSLNQLSMGLIKIRETPKTNPVKASDNSESGAPAKNEINPAFDGYVAESTNVRTSLAKTAFEAWEAGNLPHKIFGFGLGSSGIAMENFAKNGDPKEIVQNEFVEILLETGIVGALIFIAILIGFIRTIFAKKDLRWLLGIVAAFGLQWLFFSGYPSALHIYLIFAVMYIFSKK